MTFIYLFSSIACSMSNPQLNEHSDIKPISKAADNPYEIELQIESTEDDVYHLLAIVEPDKGSWFASPYSKEFFKGYFNISIEENDQLKMDDAFEEIPRSIEEVLSIEGKANVVRVKTTYKRKLNVNTQEDFEVTGLIQFVIEPQCTLEKIEFMISNRSGKMTATFIDKP